MDMMEMRFRMMAAMGGGSVSLGGLTKYQKITAQPGSLDLFVISHTLGLVPRFVLISPAESSSVTDGLFKDYGIAGDFGGSGYIGTSTQAYSYGSASHRVDTYNNYSNNVFKVTSSTVEIRRQSSSLGWDANATYQIELWG